MNLVSIGSGLAWRRIGDKPLPGPLLPWNFDQNTNFSFTKMHLKMSFAKWCIYASPRLVEMINVLVGINSQKCSMNVFRHCGLVTPYMWRHKSLITLAQVGCSLTPNYNLNWCCDVINKTIGSNSIQYQLFSIKTMDLKMSFANRHFLRVSMC